MSITVSSDNQLLFPELSEPCLPSGSRGGCSRPRNAMLRGFVSGYLRSKQQGRSGLSQQSRARSVHHQWGGVDIEKKRAGFKRKLSLDEDGTIKQEVDPDG